MCHDPIARRALGGMDGGDPGGADVAVGDVGHDVTPVSSSRWN